MLLCKGKVHKLLTCTNLSVVLDGLFQQGSVSRVNEGCLNAIVG